MWPTVGTQQCGLDCGLAWAGGAGLGMAERIVFVMDLDDELNAPSTK